MHTGLCCLVLLFLFSMAVAAHGAEPPLIVPVWPDKTIGDFGTVGPERVRDPSEAPTKDAKWITNVTHPTLTVFLPDKSKNTGVAMVICPGGGYWNLAWDLEGEEVAAWLNSVGIAGIVLKYRVPRRPGQPEDLPAPGPLLDAQRTMSLVRSRAKDWGIDPAKIGIVGFSAGGHLAVSTATSFETRAYDAIDAVDTVSCRPDFAIGVYSGYFVEKSTGRLAPWIHIYRKTPPVLLIHAADDPVSEAENSIVMYQSLLRVGISAELHVYAKGGHGFGVRKSDQPCSQWTGRCLEWLKNLGILTTGRHS